MIQLLRPAISFRWLSIAFLLATSASVLAQIPADQISPKAVKQILDIIQTKHGLKPNERKLTSNLVFASRQVRFEPIGKARKTIDRTNIDSSGMVTIKITAPARSSVLDRITSSGGTVLKTYPDQHIIMARVPLASLPDLAQSAKVAHIDEPDLAANNAGAVTGQGYIGHKAKDVVEGLGVNGSGVKVGVLSDSASSDRVAALIASGDLPANTVVLDGQANGGFNDDEGTAMMEIVHDLAPGAQLYFATAQTGAAQFAVNIASLAAAGCSVIVDDVTVFNEGVFQDGPIAQAVNTFVAGGGIYFSSAANSGSVENGNSGTWEGDFVSGGPVSPPIQEAPTVLVHNFNPTGAPVLYETLGGGTFYISLKWSDPLGASTNDYDLFVLDSTGSKVTGMSTTTQSGTSDPIEIVTGGSPPGSRIVITQYNDAGTQTATRALHLDVTRGQLSIATDGVSYGHNAGANTQSVAATFWNSARRGVAAFTGVDNPVEAFSSAGPRKIFYTPTGTLIGTGTPTFNNPAAGQTLLKPDFTAADGVTCRTPMFSPFFGTSAAAPHAAAIAALMISAKPTITNTQIHNILVNTALDNGAAGFDPVGGFGVLDALAAVNAVRALP